MTSAHARSVTAEAGRRTSWPEATLVFPVRRLAADGMEAWERVVERGYEGYVAKDEASPYEGGPTRRWLKVKQRDWTEPADA